MKILLLKDVFALQPRTAGIIIAFLRYYHGGSIFIDVGQYLIGLF